MVRKHEQPHDLLLLLFCCVFYFWCPRLLQITMMSRLLSIFQVFGPSSVRSNTHSNSWAVISLWRRFFALKEEEQELHCHEMKEFLERAGFLGALEPIRDASVVEERRRMVRDGYWEAQGVDTSSPVILRGSRHVQTREESMRVGSVNHNARNLREDQQIHRPNLGVPVNTGSGVDYRVLSQ